MCLCVLPRRRRGRRGSADAQRRMAYRRLVGRGMEADPEAAFHDFQVRPNSTDVRTAARMNGRTYEQL